MLIIDGRLLNTQLQLQEVYDSINWREEACDGVSSLSL